MSTRGSDLTRLTAILLLGLLWLGSTTGCRRAESKPPVLVKIPHPDMTSYFDDAVKRQLQSKQIALQAACERPQADQAQLGQSYGEMGMLYHAYDLYDAAEACYRNASALAPREFRWQYYLGDLYAKQGDSDSAAASFAQALAINADDLPALVHLAYAHLAANRPDEGKPFLNRALAKDRTCAYAHFGLGKIAMLQHDYTSAARHFNTALDLQPNATIIHYQLAMAYRNLKQPDKAAEHLAKRGNGVIVFPNPLMNAIEMLRVGVKRHLEIGSAAVRAGKFTEALDALHKAVREDPDNAMPRLSLAAALAKAGDRDGAIRQFHEVLRLRPGNARAHYWLGVLSATEDAAIAHFQAALNCDPQNLDARMGLAELSLKTGKHQDAATHYALAVEIDPRNPAPRTGRIVALAKAGKFGDAMATLEESRKILPRSIPLAHAAARLWASCPDDRFRNGARALELAQVVFRADQSLEHGETVAMAFAEAGNYEEARKWQTKAIEVAMRANLTDAVPRLKRHLVLYVGGKPCRTPW